MPFNYGGYNQNTGGFMSPQQAGMSQNDFRFFMNQANQMGAMQPQYGPRQPDMQNLRGGPYRPGQAPGLRPITPPVFNGGVGGMRGGAASQGGITMPAQGIRVGYGPTMPPSMPTNGNAPSRGLLMGNVTQQAPQPPAPLPMFAQSDRQYSGLSGEGQRPFAIDEQNQLAAMNRQHENMKLRDQNLPRWQSSVDEVNRQADVMENTQLPNRDAIATMQGITPQQAFMQIPGNYLTGYQNRFNAIEANRPDAPPQVTASSTSPEFRNYAQEIKDSGYLMDNLSSGAAYNAQPITPRVRANRPLSLQEQKQMEAVGSSVGEWNAKAEWMRSRGLTGNMTPDVAQAYANSKLQQRLDLNNRMNAVRARDDAMNDYYNQRKIRRRQQAFQMQNPGLFLTPDFTAAQLAYGMAGGNIDRFQNPGLSPEAQASLQIRSQESMQQRISAETDPKRKRDLENAYNSMYGPGATPPALGGQPPTAPPQPMPQMPMYGGYQSSPLPPTYGVPSGNTGAGVDRKFTPYSTADAVFNQQNTSAEEKKNTLDRWYTDGTRPTQAQLDDAGISTQDIRDWKDSKVGSLDYMLDNTPLSPFANNSSEERRKQYQWAGGLLGEFAGEKPSWWDNQFGAGWDVNSGDPRGYKPGSSTEAAINDWLPTVGAVGSMLIPYGVGKVAGAIRGARAAKKIADAATVAGAATNATKRLGQSPAITGGSPPVTAAPRPLIGQSPAITGGSVPSAVPQQPLLGYTPNVGSPQVGGGLTVRPPYQPVPIEPPVYRGVPQGLPMNRPPAIQGPPQAPMIGGQPQSRLPYYPPNNPFPPTSPPMGPSPVPVIPNGPLGGIGGQAVPQYINPQLLNNPAYLQRLRQLEFEFSGAGL